jgi:hypothetical protein
MLTIHRPTLLSIAVVGLMFLSIKLLLEVRVLPHMLKRANAMMLREVVPPLEAYFGDFQEWPAGTPEEILWHLQGARSDRVPVGPAGAQAPDPSAVVRTRQELPSVNYLRDARVGSAGMTLGDAWGRPLEFHFLPKGPAKVTSPGSDGMLGTADDVSVTAHIMPRKTLPTRAMFVADREFRRLDEARRVELARKLAEKVR